MHQTMRKLLRDRDTTTFLVVDVVVGVVVAIMSWLANDDPADALLWAMGGTAFLWIMTIRVQLGLQRYDTERRLEELGQTVERAMALRLSGFRDAEIAADLTVIVDGAAAIESSLGEPFRTFTKGQLRDFARKMASAGQEQVTVS